LRAGRAHRRRAATAATQAQGSHRQATGPPDHGESHRAGGGAARAHAASWRSELAVTAAPAYTRGMLRIGLLLALALGACADGTSRRNIEMVPLPPPSVTPEPSLPEAPTPRTSSVVEPGSALPRELPKPGRGERDA